MNLALKTTILAADPFNNPPREGRAEVTHGPSWIEKADGTVVPAYFDVEEVQPETETDWRLDIVTGLGFTGVMWVIVLLFVWAWDKQWGM